jgi:anti-sigma regulatory factor (Ser/Thr protein kinase)
MPPWAGGLMPKSGEAYIRGLAASKTAPGDARHDALKVLAVWGISGQDADTAALLITELITNAVKFGAAGDAKAADIGLALWLHDDRLVIEVTDQADGLPRLRNPRASSQSGRGLRLVDALSKEWGYYAPGSGRKTVYCVLQLADQAGRRRREVRFRGDRHVSQGPDYLAAARDELARRAEAEHPGWAISHGLYGWTATRARDQRTERAGSLPGLAALISVADSRPPAT